MLNDKKNPLLKPNVFHKGNGGNSGYDSQIKVVKNVKLHHPRYDRKTYKLDEVGSHRHRHGKNKN